MKNKDKNSVELVVLNCFIRVLKNNNDYMLYRRCLNNTGIMKSLLAKQARKSADNPFSKASSSDEVIKTLQRITDDMSKSNGHRGGIKDMDKYEHVTMTINHLLHFFMESNGIAMERLCELGQEIYNISCNKLFGDTLEDLQIQQDNDATRGMSNEDRAKLFEAFISGLQQGLIPSTMSFEEFVARKDEILPNVKRSNNHMAEGHMLGRGPEDGLRMGERPAWLDDAPVAYEEYMAEDDWNEIR